MNLRPLSPGVQGHNFKSTFEKALIPTKNQQGTDSLLVFSFQRLQRAGVQGEGRLFKKGSPRFIPVSCRRSSDRELGIGWQVLRQRGRLLP